MAADQWALNMATVIVNHKFYDAANPNQPKWARKVKNERQ